MSFQVNIDAVIKDSDDKIFLNLDNLSGKISINSCNYYTNGGFLCNNIELLGKKNEHPNLFTSNIININTNNVIIKDINFKGWKFKSEHIGSNTYNAYGLLSNNSMIGIDDPLFCIMSDTTFINCNFENFGASAIFGCNGAKISFINCKFSNLKNAIIITDNTVVDIDNCTFKDIHQNCISFNNNASFNITNTTFSICYNNVGFSYIDCLDYSSGIFDNCKFSSDLHPYNMKNITKYVLASGKSDIKFNKCNFSKTSIAIMAEKKSKIMVVESIFTENIIAINTFEKSHLFLSDCTFKKNFKTGLFLENKSTAEVFDSKFLDNINLGIFATNKSKLDIYNSDINHNGNIGIKIEDSVEIKIRNSNVSKNEKCGVLILDNCSGMLSHNSFFDNVSMNVALLDNTNVIFEYNNFYFTNYKCVEIHLYGLFCGYNSKANISKCKFYSNNLKAIGFIATHQSEVFISDCTFTKLCAVASLLEKSKAHIIDSYINHLNKNFIFEDGLNNYEFITHGCVLV